MTPTIGDGEVLIVAPVDPDRLRVADVVFCRTPARATAHRILSLDVQGDGARRLTTCGDAALETDRPVLPEQVRGRVVGVERAGRRIDLRVRTGLFGRLALVAALELRRSVRRWRARAWLGPLAPARAYG